jgi:hypothetical protein
MPKSKPTWNLFSLETRIFWGIRSWKNVSDMSWKLFTSSGPSSKNSTVSSWFAKQISWTVQPDFKAPNLPLSLRLKVSGCHYNSIYNNT